ncbi:MAG: 16S rRNA (cytidine(1402)-2'-O)-methyltransferase [Elusimicrobiota bacterium]|jgi:16S rRNA (cytidine1402-2'-O)-methyltransferase
MLYIVPTPIGNLEDVTLRTLTTLGAVKAVYCEDTRRTRILLERHGIAKPLVRYNEHDERSVSALLERLAAGDDLALVSDSGTPVLSDPGSRAVARARAAGIPVTALPGPSAVACAVSGSGLPGDSFVFLGFLPRSAGRRRRALAEAAKLGRTLVVYESPFRVLDLLRQAEEALGPDAQAVCARELSKVHEEYLRGTVREVRAALEARGGAPGEYVVLFHPGASPDAPAKESDED